MSEMKINELIKEAHENAIEKGFYDKCRRCGGARYYADISCPDCGGTGIDQDKNIPGLLMLIVGELSESIEALRNKKRAPVNFHELEDGGILYELEGGKIIRNYSKFSFDEFIKNTFEDEIADTFIRLADLCGYLKIDIEKHIKAKIKYNKTRPKKHGKEF